MKRRFPKQVAAAFALAAITSAVASASAAAAPVASNPESSVGQAASTAPSVTPPRAALTSVCRKSNKAADRELIAEATMRPVAHTRKLAIKFVLQGHPIVGGTFQNLTVGGLGKWISPTNPATLGQHPGDVWHVNQPVGSLYTGTSYRMKVAFRWYGVDKRVLKNQTLYTKTCNEPA